MKHLLGKQVLVTAGFMYAGILEEIAIDGVVLSGAVLVLDTGEWNVKKWNNARKIETPLPIWIERNSIESVIATNKTL